MVNAFRGCRSRLEALIAVTPVAANCVNTAPVFTDPRFSAAFIFILAPFSIRPAGHARRADTHEGPDQVLADHASGFTVMESLRAFIQIFTHLPILPQGIAGRASALVGSIRVDTAESTQQRILCTFIDILTGHHWAWLKPFITVTLKSTNHIGAGTIATRISY